MGGAYTHTEWRSTIPVAHPRAAVRGYRPSITPAAVTDHIPPAERERIIQDLGEHFAHDQLTLDEYERRVGDAFKLRSRQELVALTSDLRPLAPDLSAVPAKVTPTSSPVPRRRFLALLSGVVRRGAWVVPQSLNATAVMGGIDLDLREATLSAPVTEIRVVAVMGGVQITVPPHVRVESDGSAFLGGFADTILEAARADATSPVIRLRGIAVLGGVDVRVSE